MFVSEIAFIPYCFTISFIFLRIQGPFGDKVKLNIWFLIFERRESGNRAITRDPQAVNHVLQRGGFENSPAELGVSSHGLKVKLF